MLHEKRTIETLVVHVAPNIEHHDMILGQDLQQEVGTILAMCHIKSTDKKARYYFHDTIEDYKSLHERTKQHLARMTQILEAKNKPSNLNAVIYSCINLQCTPIPKAYEQTLKMQVKRLCELKFLKRIYRSEWGSTTFNIPRKIVRFISDFREINKIIQRKPFKLPK